MTAPLAASRSHVWILLQSGTLDPRYWGWFAQGTAAKPVDCELDRIDTDVAPRARFAVAGVTVRDVAPAQPTLGSAFEQSAADTLWLDAASMSLLTF